MELLGVATAAISAAFGIGLIAMRNGFDPPAGSTRRAVRPRTAVICGVVFLLYAAVRVGFAVT